MVRRTSFAPRIEGWECNERARIICASNPLVKQIFTSSFKICICHENRYEVFETTRLVTEALNIPKEKFSLSFQSRLGKGWLEPFTDIRLAEMPKQGIKKLLIVSPAFVSDCLETLEEMAFEGKEIFLHAGGESFTMIPCLNVHPLWVQAVVKLIKSHS